MKDLLHTSDKRSLTEAAATLRTALDQKYNQVRRTAQAEWERKFAGKEPSDACVSVRISSRTRAGSFERAA
jgi:hypothetical protein